MVNHLHLCHAKQLYCSCQNLPLPVVVPKLNIIVKTDSSTFSLGAVFSQVENGRKITAACTSSKEKQS